MFKQLSKFLKIPYVRFRAMEGFLSLPITTNDKEYDRAKRDVEAFNLQIDIANENLKIAHRTMLVALFAVLIALCLGLYGIFAKPNTHITIEKVQVIQK